MCNGFYQVLASLQKHTLVLNLENSALKWTSCSWVCKQAKRRCFTATGYWLENLFFCVSSKLILIMYNCISYTKECTWERDDREAGEMSQWLRVLAGQAWGPVFKSSTHIKKPDGHEHLQSQCYERQSQEAHWIAGCQLSSSLSEKVSQGSKSESDQVGPLM